MKNILEIPPPNPRQRGKTEGTKDVSILFPRWRGSVMECEVARGWKCLNFTHSQYIIDLLISKNYFLLFLQYNNILLIVSYVHTIK